MELTTEDRFGESLAQFDPAPNHHTPTFGDDVGNFIHDLGEPGLGQTGRTARAAFTSALENDIGFGISDNYQMARQYEPVIEALNQVQQRKNGGLFSNGNRIPNPFREGAIRMPPDYLIDHPGMVHQQDAIAWIWGQVDRERQRNPGVFGQLPKDHGEVEQDARAEQRAAHDYAAQLQATGGPITGTTAGFVGGAAGGLGDPLNVAASVVGFPASTSLLKTALIEGIGNATVTLAEMPERVQHYDDIGVPMSSQDIATDVTGSFVLGGAFGVGGKLVARLFGLKGEDLVREFETRYPDAPPSYRTAAAVVEDHANIEASNPFADTPEGRDLHRQSVEAAQAAIDNRRFEDVPDFSDHAEAAARELDPEAFAAFDQANQERAALRAEISRLGEERAKAPATAEAQARVDELLAKVAGVESRLSKTQAQRLVQARADLDAVLTADTPEMAAARQQLLQADIRMRDAGPGIASARARARIALAESGTAHGPADFVTSRGSTYVLHSDGTTSRNKAARSDPGHEGQSGPQPRSERTYFVTAEQADALSLFQAQGTGKMAVAPTKGGRIGVKYLEGKDAGKFERRTVVQPAGGPALGLIPVEIWNDGTRVHFGNPITQVAAHKYPDPFQDSGVPSEAVADRLQHRRVADPEALKPYSDPVKKPEAFAQQAHDLARELAPPPERPEAPPAEGAKESPYGDATPDIEALRRLPQDEVFADPDGGTTTIKDAAREIRRLARAVERLRGCLEAE